MTQEQLQEMEIERLRELLSLWLAYDMEDDDGLGEGEPVDFAKLYDDTLAAVYPDIERSFDIEEEIDDNDLPF